MNLTRRELGRMAAVGALSQLAWDLRAQDAGKGLRYGIVGLGRISMQHFMPALKASKGSRVTALVSGHRDKAEKMAAEYGVPSKSIYSYENYDAIAGNKDIDAVYIALPNSMHAEYTIRAAKAGKHVLCEKPMATTVKDSEAMIDACRKANKKLMIAYRCQYEPTNARAIRLIRDGKLGKIEAIESANGFNIAPNEWRCNRKLAGGGPLMDVGIYSLNALPLPHGRRAGRDRSALFGDRPRRPVQRSGREPVVGHEVSLRNRDKLQYNLRGEHARLLQGARLERHDPRRARLCLPGTAAHRENPG